MYRRKTLSNRVWFQARKKFLPNWAAVLEEKTFSDKSLLVNRKRYTIKL